MGGSVATGSFGFYGTLGTPAPGNAPGGRSQPVTWTDSKGNLWLFGGYGFDSVGNPGYLNDFWEFSPSTNEWIWMGGASTLPDSFSAGEGVYGTLGTPAAGNIPPGRSGQAGWTDPQGNLWLFGGFSYSSAGSNLYNDLWEYRPSINEWVWISGSNMPNQKGVYGTLGAVSSSNVPGARQTPLTWVDGQGNLWLFGGTGFDGTGTDGDLSDLWKFTPLTGQWTWVNGSNAVNQPSVPGTFQVPAAGNAPGARLEAVSWTDNSGNFWLFGGFGLNDLWQYNPSTNEWAWMSGNTALAAQNAGWPGVYGELQTPATTNLPGSRTGAVAWTDRKGNLWMFGGVGYDADNYEAFLDDLWEYNPAIHQWSWMAGSALDSIFCPDLANWCGLLGTYDGYQVASLASVPGGRYDGASWTDANGSFWLFGGIGLDGIGNSGFLSDLWQFKPNTAGLTVTATPVFSPGTGTYTSWQTVTITDATPGATIQYLIDGNPPALNYSGPLTISSSEAIEAIASAPGYANSNVASAAYTANMTAAATPVFSVAPGTYAGAQTVTISDTTPGARIYYAVGAAPATPNISFTGPITVSAPETIQAIAVANGYLNSAVASAAYNIGSNPSAQWTWMGGNHRADFNFSCPIVALCGQPGWYGTLEVPAAANYPGARFDSATWTDSAGTFWMFGGEGFDAKGIIGSLNDLWKLNPSTVQWTWMGGSNIVPCPPSNLCGVSGVYGSLGTPSASNIPGGRYGAAGWSDSQGNYWLFGGHGIDSAGTDGYLGDLWKFDATAKEWTWMGGSSTVPCNQCGPPGQYGRFAVPAGGNVPGGRMDATHWTDLSGHFWMFGGFGEDSRGIECYLNDLWEFDPTKAEWAWMDGSRFCSNIEAGWPGIYGFLGVPMAGAIPWSLQSPSAWVDTTGNLWLFGGIGEDTGGDGFYLNDMWVWYPGIDQWAWTNVNAATNGGPQQGNYGSMGNWNPANIPGPRFLASNWTDNEGNFWLFGGSGTSPTSFVWLNDLWEFKPPLNEWAWMGGSTNAIPTGDFCVAGVYGALGAPAPGNVPGSHVHAATWTDKSGNLWFFSGSGCGDNQTQGYLNDLWEYDLSGQPPPAPPSPAPTPVFSLAPGTYTSAQMVAISDAAAAATIYYTLDGSYPDSSSAVYSGPITVGTSETITAIAVPNGMSISAPASAMYVISLPQAATPTFSVPAGSYTSVQTIAISDTTAGATIYFTTDGSTPTTSSTPYKSPVILSATETLQAIAAAAGYNNSAVASATYTLNIPATFLMAATALTVNPGTTGTSTVTISSIGGYTGTVTLSCAVTASPAGASDPPTCSSNQTVTLNSGTTSGTAAVTVYTTAASSALVRHPGKGWGGAGGALLALLFVICMPTRRQKWQSTIGLVVLLAVLGGLASCGGGGGGGGGSNRGTTAGAYTVTVTGTGNDSAKTTTTTIFAVTVN